MSDSHPETLTDPEFSDPPVVTSSPPQSGDEVKGRVDKERGIAGGKGSRLFSATRDKHTSAFSLKQQRIGSAISSGLVGTLSGTSSGNRENKDHMRGVGGGSGTFAGGPINEYRSLTGTTNYAQADNLTVKPIYF